MLPICYAATSRGLSLGDALSATGWGGRVAHGDPAFAAEGGEATPPLPSGALPQKSFLLLIYSRFSALNLTMLSSILTFEAKPPSGEGRVRAGQRRERLHVRSCPTLIRKPL